MCQLLRVFGIQCSNVALPGSHVGNGGVRQAELLSCRVALLLVGDGVVAVVVIGVALNDTACEVLRDQIGKHQKWVFVHTWSAHRSDGSKASEIRKVRRDDNRAWSSACRRAGIEDFRFHDLRHTWASWLIQSGVPLSVLQEMGGWESIEMVRRYAHLAPNHLTEHARQIDVIFNEDVPNMSHQDKKENVI
ncbi:site-specific integrase [Enterobacteriaceae bacterium C23F]